MKADIDGLFEMIDEGLTDLGRHLKEMVESMFFGAVIILAYLTVLLWLIPRRIIKARQRSKAKKRLEHVIADAKAKGKAFTKALQKED